MSDFVLVLYYSRHGSVLNLARSIARGIEQQGLTARIRTVSDNHRTDDELPYPIVTEQDLKDCSGLAMGTASQFGSMASPLKAFWETTSTAWLKGELIDKPACVFTSSASLHGGNEATLLNLSLPLLHHGMILLGVPYSEPELLTTTAGGTPYGASHVSGLDNKPELTDAEKRIAVNMGQRLATICKQLNHTL